MQLRRMKVNLRAAADSKTNTDRGNLSTVLNTICSLCRCPLTDLIFTLVTCNHPGIPHQHGRELVLKRLKYARGPILPSFKLNAFITGNASTFTMSNRFYVSIRIASESSIYS